MPGATAGLPLCFVASMVSVSVLAGERSAAGAIAASNVTEPAAAGASVTTYVPYSPMPAQDNARMRWITSEVALVKDNHGGDLVAFFKGDTTLHAAVSADDGDNWAWIDPAATIGVAMPNTIAQSSDGKIHVLSDTGDLSYSRLLPQRNPSGHVNGFSAEVTNLPLPAPVNFGESMEPHVGLPTGSKAAVGCGRQRIRICPTPMAWDAPQAGMKDWCS